MSNQAKHINWLVEEFTAVELPTVTEVSPIKKAIKTATVSQDGEEASYEVMHTEYDEQGRPVKTTNFYEEGEIESEVLFTYSANRESSVLFEGGERVSEWFLEFSDKGQITRREFLDPEEQVKEVEVYAYDEQGRLTSFREAVYDKTQLVDDTAVAYKFVWEGEKLVEVLEFVGEGEDGELDARTAFEYNEQGQVINVKTFLFSEEGEELVEEQTPSYNAQGQLAENILHDHSSAERLKFRYEYDAQGELVEVQTQKYQDDDLMQETITRNNDKGYLDSRTDRDLMANMSQTEQFTYEYR